MLSRERARPSSRTDIRARARTDSGLDTRAASTEAVFARLKRVLARFASRLEVVQDEAEVYHLNSKAPGPDGKPVFFAAVRRGRAFVSYHLMPVYTHPELLDGLNLELRRCMLGKSCFHFRTLSPTILETLHALTQNGLESWKRAGLI